MEEASREAKPIRGTVCVTGANGFIASWLVMRLLERGYRVRGTVRNPENPTKTAHLFALPGAKEQLELFAADLSIDGSFDAAVSGCEGVFHTAFPVEFSNLEPQDVVDKAEHGILNVLGACARSPSVKRIVLTSTAGTSMHNEWSLHGKTLDESNWTSVDYCIKNQILLWHYLVGKTIEEKTAWSFCEQHDLNLISLNPTLVVGPFMTPHVPFSVGIPLSLLSGETQFLEYLRWSPFIHTEDVVNAHIFLYEEQGAKGRYICSATEASIDEILEFFSKKFSENNLPSDQYDPSNVKQYHFSSEKLAKLGFNFQYETIEKILDNTIDFCQERGILKNTCADKLVLES